MVDEQLRRRLAYWRGNVAALHRELVARAAAGEYRPPAVDVFGDGGVQDHLGVLVGATCR
ncbi:hypothetical protein ACFY2R_18100 [Micromonospora olivasterospora]|uniref:hypothetical protein n=1 Tax=Micromonospora olivasterospora TaxID=1880 RepID=UPI0011A97784